ncbi:MAG: hypothetical protein WCD11_08940 [Solirubrobacteraceae bacterium]
MFTSQVVPHPDSPMPISRRSGLIGLAVVGLTVLAFTLTAGESVTHSGSAAPNHAASLKFTLSHIHGLDTPESAITSAQIARASVVPGRGHDRGTRSLLKVQTGPVGQTRPALAGQLHAVH